MATEEALLAAIDADPQDDAPRLIYADWLDEHGDDSDRAEFIRVQCELERMRLNDPKRKALLSREADLLKTHREDWAKIDLSHLPATERRALHTGLITFSRGFADVLFMSPAGRNMLREVHTFIKADPVGLRSDRIFIPIMRIKG